MVQGPEAQALRLLLGSDPSSAPAGCVPMVDFLNPFLSSSENWAQ